jgi:hypothetical protein
MTLRRRNAGPGDDLPRKGGRGPRGQPWKMRTISLSKLAHVIVARLPA